MAMFEADSYRPAEYQKFVSATPEWFADAKLGIFIHWGAYSVAAWAEPVGELGGTDHEHSFAHNPYSEWYANTIRIEGSPAQQHHRDTFGDQPYEHLLDLWKAEKFDADEVLDLIKHTGARYFVPTSKHHDGIALWDAPASNGFNTVARGPRRDIISEFANATRRAGLRFGVYYSGGFDWHVQDLPPIETSVAAEQPRANDDAYAEYAYSHVADLIDKYAPDVLWDDIDWPDPGKTPGPHSLISLLEQFYEKNPEGVINDRWGNTHWDYRTTEYQMGSADNSDEPWENCRGIGYSFGYNQLEGDGVMLDGTAAVRHFVDVVSRGGNLLLNIGLMADGTVPPTQRSTLLELGDWNKVNGEAIFGSRPLDANVATPSETPWVRFTSTTGAIHAIIDAVGDITLMLASASVVPESARLMDGTPVPVKVEANGFTVSVPDLPGPLVVTFDTV